MTAEKILLCVLDGISDRPCTELGNRTPLQAARTPNLDKLARDGICGIMDPIAPGTRPGSDTAHLSLLGYPPEKYYTGRGPLEAEGCGIHMENGMIGFRANYATIDDDGIVIDRRAGRISDTGPISSAIEEGVDLSSFGVEFIFRSGAGHRAALAFKGEGLGAEVSSNDPKKEGAIPHRFEPIEDTPENRKTADILNEFTRQAAEILRDHHVNRERKEKGELPANIVLIRGAGKMGHYESFGEKYGLNGCVIAAATLITGIGTVLGLTPVGVEGITGSSDTNLAGKIEATKTELKHRDFVLLNIKGADEAGHDGDPLKKKEFIEQIDSVIPGLFVLDNCLLVFCGDHSTPCSVKDHSADPVPLLIHGEGVRTDDVNSYDEIACAKGGLHRIRGESLMPILLDLVNRSKKYGA